MSYACLSSCAYTAFDKVMYHLGYAVFLIICLGAGLALGVLLTGYWRTE